MAGFAVGILSVRELYLACSREILKDQLLFRHKRQKCIPFDRSLRAFLLVRRGLNGLWDALVAERW